MGFQFWGTDRGQKEPYQENMGDEEGFQIHIQTQQLWQLVTCGQGRCPARAEHRESDFLASFLRFPAIRLHNMHRDRPLTVPKDLRHPLSCLNPDLNPLKFPSRGRGGGGGVEPGSFYCLLCIFYSGSKWWTHVSSSQYVNWNKHPVPVPPSSRLIHYELQHSCVTSCRKWWCESCWYSCNCEGPPIKIHFSIDLSNCYSYKHVIDVYMWLPIPLKPYNLALKLVFDTERLWL